MVALPPPRFYLPAADREEDLMPERGPAQLLLLFFRPRARLGWRIGLAAACIGLLGLLPGEESVYDKAKDGITQSLRQAAWTHARRSDPATRSWPWSESEPVAYSKVHRLGLSAAVLHDKDARNSDADERSAVVLGARDPHLDLNVAVGDRITVTRADGTRQAYRVTGWEVFAEQPAGEADNADPHYQRVETPLGGSLRLMIEAEHADGLGRPEHKL
jgi:hypothetical protein